MSNLVDYRNWLWHPRTTFWIILSLWFLRSTILYSNYSNCTIRGSKLDVGALLHIYYYNKMKKYHRGLLSYVRLTITMLDYRFRYENGIYRIRIPLNKFSLLCRAVVIILRSTRVPISMHCIHQNHIRCNRWSLQMLDSRSKWHDYTRPVYTCAALIRDQHQYQQFEDKMPKRHAFSTMLVICGGWTTWDC